MSHVTHTLHEPVIHLSLFLPSLILMIYDARYNLWSYTVCIFLQFPITFSHKSLRTYQNCCQTLSAAFLQSYKPSVTLTAIKILSKHTNVYNSIASFQKAERRAKYYEAAECISPIYFFSFSSYSKFHCLLPFKNTSSSPPFQIFKECIK
jgi:hypothetical protein